MDREVLVGCVYKHFKGKEYKVIHIAAHSETNEKMVVYENDNGEVWVRPYDMFNSYVDTVKYPDIKQKYRFELKNKGGNENG